MNETKEGISVRKLELDVVSILTVEPGINCQGSLTLQATIKVVDGEILSICLKEEDVHIIADRNGIIGCVSRPSWRREEFPNWPNP